MFGDLRVERVGRERLFALKQSKPRFRYDEMKVPELTTHRAIAFSDGQTRRCGHLEAHFSAVTASAMANHALSCRFAGNRLPCVHTRAQSPGNALGASSRPPVP